MNVDEFIAQRIEDRQERMKAIEQYTEDNPDLDNYALEKLTDYILREELTDTTAWKGRQSEYTFLSETQLARRKEGIHQRKNEGGQREVSLKKAATISTSGLDTRKPSRRERSDNENLFLDYATYSRNKERARKYREFTATQPVITYHISELGGDYDN